MFYDKGILAQKNTNWYNVSDGFKITPDTEGTLLEYNRSSGWANIYANQNDNTSRPFSIGSCIELDVVNCTGNIRLQAYDGTTARLQLTLPTNATNYHIKISIAETTITTIINGVTNTYTTSSYINDDFQVNFASNTVDASVKYKEFMIYPI